MNHNTNEKPTGGKKEKRLALAFGRAYSGTDDMSPLWLGSLYVDEQRTGLERVAKEQGFELVMFAIAYQTGGPGRISVLTELERFAKEHDIDALLVPSMRYLSGSSEEDPPYPAERILQQAGIEIVEAPLTAWL